MDVREGIIAREEWRDHLALCQPLLGPLVNSNALVFIVILWTTLILTSLSAAVTELLNFSLLSASGEQENKVIWKQAASPPPVADILTAAAHNRLTVFARWRQCARPFNSRFHGFIPLTIPNDILSESVIRSFFHNTRSLPTNRQTDRPTERQPN